MELRRPTLEDKDAILEMIAEFDAAKSYMHGGMGSVWKQAKDYEDWLKIVEQQEDAANLPVGWVTAIKFLSFDETGLPLGFLGLAISEERVVIVLSSVFSAPTMTRSSRPAWMA